MKQIYVVMSNGYHEKPLMAYENRNDAVKSACAIHEVDAADAGRHIKAVPFMFDQPKHVDVTDVQMIIDMTLQAVESVKKLGDDND